MSPPPSGEEASYSSLPEFFYRCLRKGHWELARACLPQLSRGPDAGGVEEILRGLVRAPHLLSYDEEHTPQKLAWFWLNALEVWLAWADKQLPDILKDETEFLLLLEEFQNGATEQTVKELYEAFLYSHSELKENRRETPSPRFSEATVSSLQGALSQNPRLVQSLIGFLLVDDAHPVCIEYNHYLLNITVNFLLDLLSSLQRVDEAGSTDSASCTVDQVYSVLSTMHFNMELQAGELRRLCEELYNICSDKGILSEDRVQACLLRKQNYALVSLYGIVSTEKIRARISTLKSPGRGATQELGDTERAVLTLFYDPERAKSWKKIYFYSISTGKHFLEQILLTALALLKKEDFSSLDMLLSNEFKPLRHLLVLLGWTHLQSTESAKSLLRVMRKDMDLCNDSLFKDFCDGLMYQVEALEWCLEHSRQEISRKDVLHHLCTLDSHSSLYILHHLTNLPQLNEDEVLKLLRKGLAEEGYSEREDLHELTQHRNIVVFQAFCAMKYAIYSLCVSAPSHAQGKDYHTYQLTSSLEDGEYGKSSEFPNLFVQYLTKCQYYLYPLPLPLKLELLENIFSLMFISVADLGSEPPLPEGYAVEEAEEDLELKVGRLGSLDSSTEKGESALVMSPMESPQHNNSSVIITDLNNTAQGSTPCALENSPNNLWDLVGSNYIDLKHFASRLSGFLVDEIVLDSFLKMLKEQVDLIKDSIHMSDHELAGERTLFTSMSQDFRNRVSQLSKYISEAQWRYKVVTSNRNAEYDFVSARLQLKTYKTASIKRRRRAKGSGSRKQNESTSSELSTSESSASNLSARTDMDGRGYLQQRNNLIPMMLSTPESLLISCILRGNYTDAHEVSRRFNLQSSPSHGELIFMERYQEVIRELSKVEKKMENQTSEVGIKKPGSSRSTLQAIGNAAAAGVVFYSISDVTDKLVAPAECLIPALQEDFWLRSAHLEKTDRWKHVVEELNPAAMAAFDLACTQAHLWKTCKQLLETAERRLQNCLQSKGRPSDVIMEHPEGIRGVQAFLQQMSKIINYPSLPQGQTEIEEKISMHLKCSMTELLHSCYSLLRDEHMVRHITLSHELENNIAQLRSAVASFELKGNVIQSLMDQASMKHQDVQVHPVRKQMILLQNNLDELAQLLDNRSLAFNPICCFFTYIDTLAKVIIQSTNSDLETSLEVKVANPFVLLHQKPSQVVSHLLFERQVPPERLSYLLKKENLGLNVEQVIADYCCGNLSFCNMRKVNQVQHLLLGLVRSAQQCVDASLPNMDIAMSVSPPDSEDSALSTPTSPSESSQYSLTASVLNFLKTKSTLTAAVACLSAIKSPKPAKSGLSWIELRGSKKESPLEMENIAKECDSLLSEFPVLQRFITLMSAPFRDGSQELSGLSSLLCGKPCIASVLLGLHAPSASAVLAEAFQDALSKKNWTSALQLLNLYARDFDLEQVKDALRCCAAAEEKEGWRYLFAVKDATLRSTLTLRFLDKWPLDACMEILSYCVCEMDVEDSLKLELQSKRKELEVYRKILSLQEDIAWESWQDLKEDCTKDPQAIITIILEAKDYLLCEDWGLFYPIPADLLINLYREHLLHLLEKKDTEKSLQLLKRVEDQDLRLAITEQALFQNPGIFASHFLSEYLLAHFLNGLLEMRCNEIRNIFLGSKVLLALPESAHSNYEHLISSPLLMLEQLLMNMKIEWVSVAVQTLQQLLIQPDFTFSIEDVDNMLCTYAGKALDIPFSLREKRTDSVSRVPESISQASDTEGSPSSSGEQNSVFGDRSRLQTPEKGHRRNKSSPEFVPPDKPPAKAHWIPDETETTCMVCKNEKFTMFNRRHHCRRCGRLVCSSCSMKKMVVEDCRENPARVCDQCYNYFNADAYKTEEDFEQLEETTGGNLDLSEVLRLSKAAEVQWWLTLNEAENEVERNEFYYEQAPSASLCSAILNLHSKRDECGYQLIERCCLLSKGLTNPEMDSRLLLDIMKTLLFSAKMIFVKAARSHDLALCDSYSSKVDLLKILVAASYQDIPSLDEIVRPAAVVRLRNQLLEAEYYNLAIEVSTKMGLDPSGVWHAWGMACLKSDNLPGAREKFSRCMKAPLDLNQRNIGSKPLEDVIQQLESAAKPLLLVKDDEYFATLKELEVTLKARCLWYEMMPEGKIQNNTYYQECLYYLHTYGTHLGIIQFYMRHDLMRDALLHLLHKECPGDIFIEGIFVPSYESGKLQVLETMLESLDSSLESWSTYLIDACKHLQQKNYYNILYELQQFMKDHVRAAMTCIRFFSHKAKNYRELGNNQTWLVKSKEHLKISLQEVSRSNRRKSYDTFRKKMSATDVSRHINTVELQMEITKFLQRCESLQTGQEYDKPPPTLFGHSAMMIDVASRVILGGKNVEEGFGIAFRVIQDFQLDAFKVYSKVCKQLVQQENYSEILLLVKCVSESGIAAEKDCDQILLRCVEEMADVPSDDLEKLIQGMRSDETKIKAFLACRMMRSAYLTAVKQEHERAIQLVQEVWQAAHNIHDSVVQGICSKWLVEHPPVSKQTPRQSSRKVILVPST
ncbi:zinc finger FYVE domain-containing protein 26 [Hyla sarda]|uniref:zinc finger FYVE domain-containing protein 26 n=1 Tax=Hyla sarda TaxID=327740 RepID=UPI0024C41AFC|nr:zinc finger FYVE domain-containing protein 26 [Hyla sarda]